MKCLIRFLLDIYQNIKTGHLCLDQHKYALPFITFAQSYPHWAIRTYQVGLFVLLTADSILVHLQNQLNCHHCNFGLFVLPTANIVLVHLQNQLNCHHCNFGLFVLLTADSVLVHLQNQLNCHHCNFGLFVLLTADSVLVHLQNQLNRHHCGFTTDWRQSKRSKQSTNPDEKSLETVFTIAILSPVGRQMAIENSVSNYF